MIFLYYLLFSSSVLIYGIGFNTAIILCDSISAQKLQFLKTILTLLVTTVATSAICTSFIVPLKLAPLYPLVCIVIFLGISIFFETMIRITTAKTTSNFSFSFLIILLALNESVNLLEAVLICLSSLLSFILVMLLTHIIKRNSTYARDTSVNFRALVLLAMATLLASTFFVDLTKFAKGGVL